MAGVWVALEDIDADNGPLHYVPGSHLLPVFGPDQLDLAGDFAAGYAEYEDFVEALVDARGMERKTIEVPRGRAVVWAANVLHGGSPVLDPARTRSSQVTHYYFEGASYYTPMTSEVFLGRVHFRVDELSDVRTGAPIAHSYKGHPFHPPAPVHQPVTPARHGGDPGAISSPGTDKRFVAWARRKLRRVRNALT
jgi:hypothetical protein